VTRTSERGFNLIEATLALSLLLIVSLGLLPLGAVATSTTENQGHLMARTTEYAQDKLEQLMSLSFGDSTTDTRVFPATDTGGTGLTVGGSSDPSAPVNLYVDYLDIDGTLMPSVGGAAPSGWFYKRAWQVSSVSGTLKKIIVTAVTSSSVGGKIGRIPRSTVVTLKSDPF